RRIAEARPVHNEVRRLYRLVWLIYGLGLTILGVQKIVMYILMFPSVSGLVPPNSAALANACTLLAAGLPLWLVAWRAMQTGLDQPGERESMLRWVLLYLLSLAGVGTVLTTAGMVLADLLTGLLGVSISGSQLLSNVRQPLAWAIPLGGVWAYYGSILQRQIADTPDVHRRAALHRLYYYILSAFGVGTVVSGLILLGGYLVSMLLGSSTLQIAQPSRLANALAVLAVGLPLWLVVWRPMSAEARLEGEEGDRARHSPIRKTYLYLALFAGVIGSMVSAWGTLSPLFKAWFGSSEVNLAQTAWRNLSYLVIFLVLLAYHWVALRVDGRAAAQALALRHSRFAVLVIAAEEEYLHAVQAALQRHAPNIPVTGLILTQGAPEAEPQSFQAVVLPASMAIHPTGELRTWLDAFTGERLVLPISADGWAWVGSGERSLREWAEQTAHAVRLRAEGLPLRPAAASGPWVVAGYVFGGLFAVELLFLLVSLLLSTVIR
ncbi:MAG: DUF5671 domain-containing protein, partial [Anaerolineaceae bacterium]